VFSFITRSFLALMAAVFSAASCWPTVFCWLSSDSALFSWRYRAIASSLVFTAAVAFSSSAFSHSSVRPVLRRR
jgi:hypothetical protein